MPQVRPPDAVQPLWFHPDDDDGFPEALAGQLGVAQVAPLAAQRLDDFEHIHREHQQNRKEQALGALGLAGLVLSALPSVPATYSACAAAATGDGWECAAQLSALVGSALALGVTLWTAYELYSRPDHLVAELARLNAELERAMQALNDGTVPVLAPLSQVRRMDAAHRERFRAALHDHSRQLPDDLRAARQLAAALP